MEWVLILALGVWVFLQERRIRQLERKAAEPPPAQPLARPWRAEPEPAPRPPAAPSPLPAAEANAAPPAPEPAPVQAVQPQPEPLPAAAPAPRIAEASPAAPRAAPPPARPAEPGVSLSDWLAENGLAWLGGGGLALGGLLLVVYAAQAGFFTPPRQIAAALVAGAAMIGASEWLRRRPDAALAAALAAGAGASTLYGAVWAAHGLYHLIAPEAAVAGVAAVSLGLLGLAPRHGQPLANLAIAGAFAAPLVAAQEPWRALGLTAYVLGVAAAGFVVAAARRWGGAGIATLAGLGLWTLASSVIGGPRDAGYGAVMTLAGPAGALAAALWRRRRRDAPVADAFSILPTVAMFAAAIVELTLWRGALGIAAAAAGALAALAAFAAARRVIAPGVYLAPAGAAALGAVTAFLVPIHPPTSAGAQAEVFALAAAVAAAGLVGGRRLAAGRPAIVGGGAIAAAALVNVVWLGLNAAGAPLDFGLPTAVAVALAAGAGLLARRSADAAADLTLALWIAGTAELVFLSLHAGFVREWAPAAHAAAALGLALLARRLGWRGLALTAVAGGLVTLAALLRPTLVSEALGGRLPWPQVAALTGIASALLLAGGRVLLERSRANAEALASTALMTALMGAFLVLHALVGEPGAKLGPLLESSLRTVLMLAAALLLAWRAGPADGAIAKARLYVVLSLGALHGLYFQGLVYNPIGGIDPTPLGPPIANTLALAFLAPAGLLAAIAWRGVAGPAFWRRASAAAGFVFALGWALLEVRHGFHGEAMAEPGVTRPEAVLQASVLLVAAAGLAEVRRHRGSERWAPASWLGAAARPFAWAALAIGALVLWLGANPWWGWQNEPFADAAEAALTLGGYVLAAAATFLVARGARGSAWTDVGRAAATALFVDALVIAALAVRLVFHGLDPGEAAAGGPEILCHTAILLAGGWGLLDVRRRPERLERLLDPAWLVAAAPLFTAGTFAVSAVALWWWANPWWGPAAAPLASTADGAALFGLYGLATALTLQIVREAAASRAEFLRRAGMSVAVVDGFVILTLLIRWAFRGDDMRAAVLEASLETWTYSAVWALYGLGVLVAGARRRDEVLRWLGLGVLLVVAAKVVLFDTARLSGFIRAFSVLFVSALFLAGAVMARRLNAAAPNGKGAPEQSP